MGKIKLFPTTEYSSKQPSDPVVPLVPCTGIFLGPSKSGKTVALISLILEQSRGVFERIYVFSPSVNTDDGWIPVKKYIEGDLGANTAGADVLGRVGRGGAAAHHPAATEASKKLEMKKPVKSGLPQEAGRYPSCATRGPSAGAWNGRRAKLRNSK